MPTHALPAMSRRLSRFVAMGVGVVLLLTASEHGGRSASQRDRAFARLVRVTEGQRLTDGRLSGFAHASKTRAANAATLQVMHASLAEGSSRLIDAEALHVRGVALLLLRNVDAAVDALRRAAERSPTDAAILNDRAVTHLERAARTGSARDLVDAYELADQALRLDPELREAWFNRALSIERLGLRADAVAAWQEYVQRDAGSAWADEAAMSLRSLDRPTKEMRWDAERPRFEAAAAAADTATVRVIATRYPQQVRLHFEDAMTSAWARSESAGDSAAAERAFHAMGLVADALERTTANTLPRRTVAAIGATAKNPSARTTLVRGHLAYAKAIAHYRRLEINVAEPEFLTAERLLAQSPAALLALFYRASSRSYAHDMIGALALLEECERRIFAAGVVGTPLHGNVHWVRGRALLRRGFPHESLVSFREALPVFERSGEVESVASVHDLLAWNFEFLGDEDRAWSHYVKALRTLDGGHPRRERVVVHDIADYATNCGRSRIALLFASAFVRLVQQDSDVSELAIAFVERSRAWKAVGEYERARADLREAKRMESRVGDPGLRAELNAALAVAEAEAEETLPAFDRAVQMLERVERKTVLPRVWIERARAARALQRDDEAERSLRVAIELIEQQRATVADRDLSIGFAEEWYRAFDAMIEVLADQERFTDALQFAERSRARVLLQEVTSGNRDPAVSLNAITTQIPERAAVVVYALLEHSSVIWIVRHDSVISQRIAFSRLEIADMVEQWQASRENEHDERRALAALYDAIIRPVAARIHPGERLIFAPDKSLQTVPFAALYDRATRRWLVQDHDIGIVPSLTLFATSLARDRAMTRLGRDQLLIVGDPAFDPQKFPEFSRLPYAATEARAIAAEYGSAEVLLGADATRERIFDRARDAQVIHLAAHTAINPVHPTHSALLLSPDALYAFEIDRSLFPSTRLLVLAACRTAGSRSSNYEGPLGLARSFLTTGVPTVVATLWDIDDAASSDVMLMLHRRLRAGDDAPAALRNAQLRMIAHPDHRRRQVAAWAGFQTIGGFFEN